MKRQVTHINNDILYTWDNVPEIKYQNWLKMSAPKISNDYSVDGYPFFVPVEPTNFCNLECPVCPAGGLGFKRPKRHMQLNEFKSIIDDMENYLLFVTLWDWGEPLLNPDLPGIARHAHERDIKTVTSTNCNCNNFHDEGYMERLLRSGLNTLILAVDSAQQDNYEVYRTKGNLNKALQGIRKAVALKKKLGSQTLLMLRMVLMKHNELEIGLMRKLSRELGVDRFSVKTVNPNYISESSDADIVPKKLAYRRYEYKKGTYQRIPLNFTCAVVSRQCTIHSDGDVSSCCWCYDNDYSAGNCFKEGGLTKIWNSPAYRNFRKRIIENRDSIHYCRTCSLKYKFSRTGWFYQTVDLTQSRKKQWEYMFKRYLELNLPPETVQAIVLIKKKIGSFFIRQ